ncbi:EVE domain protein [Enhygromyxa salina]|uniref:EVE domain protein n=1 Tax=Enhygromyxa salina TaxID=215803 RepID=A0A2S9XD34_9BACT|nr:EVE domain-containing protein [Enhygromyxa salina]PRP90680.1 EVE domain protein [Enhygromyxa salina]
MARRKRRYWLMKSEPDVYSIDDLARDKRGEWEGVRNYQARNFMRDEMAIGDLVLFYHSNAKPPGVAGVARVVTEAYPDHHAFDEASNYYDPKSDPEAPRWWMVDVEFVEKLPELVTLDALKAEAQPEGPLEGMLVARRGQRLSIQPVDKAHFARVLRLGGAKTRVR